jgi:UDP-glucose 4-epimerase
VKRIVFASTINVWGQGNYKIGTKVIAPPYLPIDENVPPRPEDGYALSKLANEQVLRGFSDAHGIRAYCLRLPAVWRPEQTERFTPPPLESLPPLTPTRIIDPWNYIDIRDVADAFQSALEIPTLPEFGVSYLLAADTTRPEPTQELLQRFIPEWLPLANDKLPAHAPWFSSATAERDLAWKPVHTWRNRV